MATIPPGPGTPRLAAAQTSDHQPLPAQGLFPLPNYRITPPRVASETPVASAVSTPWPPAGAMARQGTALEVLPYEIVDYSSYSSEFYPDYIKVNQPTTGKSRWSSAANNQRQYLTLRLERPCLLQSITFGKFTRKHVCNLKEFRILAAATENQWVEVLHSGLRDDSEPETFTVRHTLRDAGLPMPVTWIKIVPLMTYDIKFNFSVWYVELRGVRDPAVIDPLVDQYRQYCQRMALRMCLKLLHDRDPAHFDADALLGSAEASQLPSVLDDPLVTDLHASTLAGQFDHLEALLAQCEAQHLFAEYITQAPYTAQWQLIQSNSSHRPCGRGGHQLVFDETRGCLYLFGGWTGAKNLCDFWAYDVHHQAWTLLSDDVSSQGGPSPRSCHTMCLCPKTQRIYFLGRYVDPELRNSAPLDNDFYVYHIDTHNWTLLSSNTEIDGGPRLSFDFEMCIDSDQQMLYVFGGRTLSLDSCECVLSGLYRYDIADRHWTVLRHDVLPNETDAPLRTRMERSMLFDPVARRLLIISAQRDSHSSREFSLYDIATDTVYEKVTTPLHSPLYSDKRYTHRATYDCQRQEVHIFTGRTDKPPVTMDRSDASEVSNTLWTYHVPTERWTEVYTTHHASLAGSKGLGQSMADRSRPSLAAPAATRYPEAKSMLTALCPEYAHYFEANGGTGQAEKRHRSQGPAWSRGSSTPCPAPGAMTAGRKGPGAKVAPPLVHAKPVFPPEPEPRIAHHFVYDSQSRTHYLFGGTALPLLPADMPSSLDSASDGLSRSGAGYFQGSPATGIVSTKRAPLQAGHRLDDLWQLRLTKPAGAQIRMYLQFLVRRQRYLEMCLGFGDGEHQRAPRLLGALQYLQDAVYHVVDPQDPGQLQQFHGLAPALLTAWPTSATVCEQMVHAARCCLFEELLAYLPRATKQPPGQLADVVVPWLEAQHGE